MRAWLEIATRGRSAEPIASDNAGLSVDRVDLGLPPRGSSARRGLGPAFGPVSAGQPQVRDDRPVIGRVTRAQVDPARLDGEATDEDVVDRGRAG